MKPRSPEKAKKAIADSSCGHWNQMNRQQRRDVMRKMQSDDLSLEVVHPDAAGIDIGNESHYVAVPSTRDSQPVRRFGCTTAELKAMAHWLKQCGIQTIAMQSTECHWRRNRMSQSRSRFFPTLVGSRFIFEAALRRKAVSARRESVWVRRLSRPRLYALT